MTIKIDTSHKSDSESDTTSDASNPIHLDDSDEDLKKWRMRKR